MAGGGGGRMVGDGDRAEESCSKSLSSKFRVKWKGNKPGN